ncbi:MAG: hypothetical protein Q4C98_08625 [Capnocytophaga sp.]|nr:hypothetical protein [Capnocytophaga sp.]
MEKFQNKYRIPPARLYCYDYSSQGLYFITICTKDRIPFFGNIENGYMTLNKLGEVVTEEWLKTPTIRSDMNLELGEFVVMPNHFHGIISIGENMYNSEIQYNETQNSQILSLREWQENKFQPQRKNLASIVRGFKSAITQFAKIHNIDFAWQSRYYDRVIRDFNELENISNYIIKNPSNWKNDEYIV